MRTATTRDDTRMMIGMITNTTCVAALLVSLILGAPTEGTPDKNQDSEAPNINQGTVVINNTSWRDCCLLYVHCIDDECYLGRPGTEKLTCTVSFHTASLAVVKRC